MHGSSTLVVESEPSACVRARAREWAPTFTALWEKTSHSSAPFASTEIGHWNRWIANSTIKAVSSVSRLIHTVFPAAVPHRQTAQTAGWHGIHLSDVRLAEGLVNGPETDSDILTNRICCTCRAVHRRTPHVHMLMPQTVLPTDSGCMLHTLAHRRPVRRKTLRQ